MVYLIFHELGIPTNQEILLGITKQGDPVGHNLTQTWLRPMFEHRVPHGTPKFAG